MAVTFTNVPTSRAGVTGGTFPAEEIEGLQLGWNPRFQIDEAKILELAEQIAASPTGQREPVHVKKGKDGQPLILAGQRRRLAILHINRNLIDYMSKYTHIQGPFGLKFIYVEGLSDKEAIKHSISENTDREGLTPIDQAKTILSLRNMGWEDTEIAASLRVSVTQLGNLLGFLELPEDAQEALHKGEITQQLAKEVRSLPDEEITCTVTKVKKGKVSAAQAVRETKAKKREGGKRVTLTAKEFFDELARLVDDHNLAFDLDAYYHGQSEFKSMKDIVEFYDLEVEDMTTHVKVGMNGKGRK